MSTLLWPRPTGGAGSPSATVDDPTRENLYWAIQQVEPGGVVTVAPGTYDIEGGGDPIEIDRSVRLVLTGVTLNVLDHATPTDLFQITAGDGTRVTIIDGTVNGPAEWTEVVNFMLWSTPGESDVRLLVDGLTVTGQFEYTIVRTGGGHLAIHDCRFDNYEGCIGFYGPSGEPGSLVIEDSELSCTDGKTTSIGIYIHPHFHVESARNHYHDFDRYGIYSNGTPEGAYPSVVSIDDTFVDCAIIQATHQSTAYILGATSSGQTADASATLIRGDAMFAGCTFDQGRAIGTLSADYPHVVTFVDCHVIVGSLLLGINGNDDSRLRFMGTTIDLLADSPAYALTTNSTFTGTIYMGDTVINDFGSIAAWVIQTQSACTIDWGNCVIRTDKDPEDALSQIHASTTQIGAPTFEPAPT